MSDYRIEVRDVTGKVWESRTDSFDADELDTLHKVLADISELDTFKLDLADGQRVYLNPAHIVAIQVLEERP